MLQIQLLLSVSRQVACCLCHWAQAFIEALQLHQLAHRLVTWPTHLWNLRPENVMPSAGWNWSLLPECIWTLRGHQVFWTECQGLPWVLDERLAQCDTPAPLSFIPHWIFGALRIICPPQLVLCFPLCWQLLANTCLWLCSAHQHTLLHLNYCASNVEGYTVHLSVVFKRWQAMVVAKRATSLPFVIWDPRLILCKILWASHLHKFSISPNRSIMLLTITQTMYFSL